MKMWKISFIAVAILVTSGVVANGSLFFEDNFNDGDASGWEEYDGVFSVVSGEYQIESTGFGNDARAVIGESTWTDYVINLDFNLTRSDLTSHHTAILFRVEEIASGTDAGKYYQFYMTRDAVGFAELDYSSGNATVLAGTPYSLSLATWHHVQLRVEGASASAYIDGDLVLSHDGFDAYPAGKIGLKTMNDGVTSFDNVDVNPEPATLGLLFIGGLALLRRRK